MTQEDQGRGKVLIVDDDPVVLKTARSILTREGFEVIAIDDAVEGLSVVKDPEIDVAVLDIKMPNLSGMDLLKAFRHARADVEVIMMTAFATVETAVEAVKAGAYDYLTKPFDDIDDLTLAVRRAVQKKRLHDRTRVLEARLEQRPQFEELVGQSSLMQAVFKLIDTVAWSTATVLITGESGTGKELVARACHYRSPRREKPFVAINCSALSETLLESELFGHVKGSFTGALGNKVGLFEAANGGTIFLDEIGDLPAATQVRLLRVLQEGEVKPVGANVPTRVDVRVIAATRVDLPKAMAEGRFREDLYYRLNVISAHLPPLRERPEDVPLLASHFLTKYWKKTGKRVEGFSQEAMAALCTARWQGNVRELENVMERAVIMCAGPLVQLTDLPAHLQAVQRSSSEVEVTSLVHLPYSEAKQLSIRAFERRYLSTLLEKHGGRIAQAARAANLDRSNLRRLLKQFGVEVIRSDKVGTTPAAQDDDLDDLPASTHKN